MSGTAAAGGRRGLLGVAPEAALLAGKVLGGDGAGESRWVAAGIRWAAAWRGPGGARVRVISLSLAGPDDDPDLHQAVREAVAAGVLVVCAAGNDGPGHVEYPAAYPEVVEVGATDKRDRIASFSDTNPELDLVAPGVDVLSTYPGGRYATLSGTSMSAPHVAGAAALIAQQEEAAYQRPLAEAELFAQLIKRTRSLGYPKTDQGAGLLYFAPELHYQRRVARQSYRVQIKAS